MGYTRAFNIGFFCLFMYDLYKAPLRRRHRNKIIITTRVMDYTMCLHITTTTTTTTRTIKVIERVHTGRPYYYIAASVL